MAVLPSGDRKPSLPVPSYLRVPVSYPEETAWSETTEYSATFDDVRRRLEQLEAIDRSSYLHLPGSDWDREMQSIHATLDRLGTNPTIDTGRFE